MYLCSFPFVAPRLWRDTGRKVVKLLFKDGVFELSPAEGFPTQAETTTYLYHFRSNESIVAPTASCNVLPLRGNYMSGNFSLKHATITSTRKPSLLSHCPQ